jgi:hypothetical protein
LTGSWARHFATAVAGDAQGDGAVRDVRVEPGAIFAEVVAADASSCRVALLAPLLPEGVWSAVERFARTRAALWAGVEARVQSEQLEHLLAEDWEEPLVPDPGAIARPCTCDAGGDCDHVAAVAYAVADAIDDDPSLLLRWRGVGATAGAAVADPWRGGPLLPEIEAPRPWPAGTILMRLGESGIRVADAELATVLRRAYVAFAG